MGLIISKDIQGCAISATRAVRNAKEAVLWSALVAIKDSSSWITGHARNNPVLITIVSTMQRRTSVKGALKIAQLAKERTLISANLASPITV